MFSFMLLRIFDNPSVHKKLMEEIRKNIKTSKDFTFENLKQLKYLDWIQYETIRLDNSGEILFDRIASKDTLLSDIPIRKGTLFNFLVQSRFYDDTIFDDALEFRPERWEKENQELLNFVMMRFNVGPRTCIGKQLGLLESKLATVKFLMRYDGLKELQKRELVIKFSYTLKNAMVTFRKNPS